MIIKIKNIRTRTFIGVFEWEKNILQDIIINVLIEFDGTKAAQSDALEDTVDYKKIKMDIMNLTEQKSFGLIEKMASEIVKLIMTNDKVLRTEVEIDKPGALRPLSMFDKIKDFEIRISPFTAKIQKAKEEAAKRIVGQEDMIHALLTGMLTGGHILLEGLPGLAKTLAVKTLADITSLSFKRIQFTPDMLPADILGTQVYRPQDGTFFTKKGPLFAIWY
ncbi:hypothetical protein CHS0354_030074 [Potamilus streckersoni]|uniref:Dihydroneopterin aldolase/epimerase domain-containing protein n=1 Tax=Potamilus streckersoni TaxID=2493646 RepID=A0AAE0RLJ0_9BIVA|nr:hypothetical protein CHS0354_030074 [Potamilus streckersoni]